MERRNNQRRSRRVQIRFWKSGDPLAYSGYSTNISPTGMFISTSQPVGRGSRVRVEVQDPTRGFVVESIVVHALRVAPALQQVRLSGMGVRFVRVEDLVSDLFRPGQAAENESTPIDGVYPMRFSSQGQFFEAYQRDMQTGGLFVRTRQPAPMNATVVVAIHPPDGDGEPIRIQARVVHRFDAQAGTTGGMGLAFIDTQDALQRLQPLVDRLRH